MAYVGTPIDTTNQFQSLQGKRFNGDGSTTAFTLDVAPSSTLDIEVFVENVRQDPNSAYTLSGTTLTFTGAPASGTNNIYVVHQAKAVGTINPPDASVNSDKLTGDLVTPGTLDVNGQELILDADADTSITADTDDQIDFKTGGTDRAIINSNGRVIIGHSSQLTTGNTIAGLQVHGTSNDSASLSVMRFNSGGGSADLILGQSRNSSIGGNTIVNNADNVGMIKFVADDGTDYVSSVAEIRCDIDTSPGANDTPGRLRFSTTADGSNSVTERMRINSAGNVLIGTTNTNPASGNVAGTCIRADSSQIGLSVTGDGNTAAQFNIKGTDGNLINLLGDGTIEGTITISGNTISYNGFTGTHWTRLADNSKPTILRGTIMESLDEMCDWYQAVADVGEVKDSEGNVTTPSYKVKEYINLGSKNVGDDITFTSDGVEYTGKIEKEGDVKHAKAKVSDAEASKSVYGLFVTWDGDNTTYNDILVAQTGTYIIRIHKDETVAKGDLIQSKGDGTGKVQADDIMRSSTVAKVLSTTKIETYSDGSYIVPCSLHC